MSILKNIKENIWKKKIIKFSKKNKRNTSFLHINDANSLAFICSDNNSSIIEIIEKIKKNQFSKNKTIDFFILKNSKNITENLDNINLLEKSKITLFGKIKDEKINTFLNQKYDILINLDMTIDMQTLYLSALTNAKFKVAKFSEFNAKIFDFMIKIPNDSNLSMLIEQIMYYLNKNNNK